MSAHWSGPRGPVPGPDDRSRIERALGWRPVGFRQATPERGGSDTAARWIVDDGGRGARARSAFVKVGATAVTAAWTRVEHDVYRSLDGRPYLPRLLGFDDDGSRPVLAVEDLSGADWPPPWTPDRVQAVLDVLQAVSATPPPGNGRVLERDDMGRAGPRDPRSRRRLSA